MPKNIFTSFANSPAPSLWIAKVIFVLGLLAMSGDASASRGFLIFGWGDKIHKVADLPDNESLRLKSGEYIDYGYTYNYVSVLFVPVLTFGGRWIGYIGSNQEYINIGKDKLDKLAVLNGARPANSPSMPFWDYYGTRGLWALVGFLILRKIYRSFNAEYEPTASDFR